MHDNVIFGMNAKECATYPSESEIKGHNLKGLIGPFCVLRPVPLTFHYGGYACKVYTVEYTM